MTATGEGTGPRPGDEECRSLREDLVLYVDGELEGEALERFRDHLARCTECQREVAIQRALKGELQAMSEAHGGPPGGSVWDEVNRSLARPTGWVFFIIGAILYAAYAVYTFIQSPMDLVERLAIGLLVIGFLILLTSVGWERIKDYKTDPYKGVER